MRLPLPFPLSLVRLFGPAVTVAGVVAVLLLAATGRLDLKKLAGRLTPGEDSVVAPVEPLPSTGTGSDNCKPENLITIASFNIQNFGESKSGKPEVMRELAQIMLYFDLIAVQEVQSPHAEPVQKLVDLINTSGARYQYLLSEQVFRTNHKEQYAYIYDSTRIRVIDPTRRAYVIQDPEDRMHREPYVAAFAAIPTQNPQSASRAPFTFTLINAHTDPDEVGGSTTTNNELDVLADTYNNIRNWEYQNFGEDDFFLLGDLNAQQDSLRALSRIPGLTSVCGDIPTNTAGTKQWDHILVDTTITAEFVSRAGVLIYQRDLNLTDEQAKAVSDHRPIWAQFSAFEQPYDPSLATRNTNYRN